MPMSQAPSELLIRPAGPEDAAAMAALWHICTAEVAVHEPIYTPHMDHATLTALLAGELATGARFGWLAQADNPAAENNPLAETNPVADESTLAGYVTCRMEDELPVFPPSPYLYVIDLDVAPAFRRRGVSRLLMGATEAFARARGIARIELAVAAADPRARAVWEAQGFQPHLVMMHKDLQ
jgi:ribosomal protein S18 acetylase RimI-like enzyme